MEFLLPLPGDSRPAMNVYSILEKKRRNVAIEKAKKVVDMVKKIVAGRTNHIFFKARDTRIKELRACDRHPLVFEYPKIT